MEMQLLLYQQWAEALNLKQEVRIISLFISQIFDTVYTTCSTKGHLHIKISNFFHLHHQHVAINILGPGRLTPQPSIEGAEVCPGYHDCTVLFQVKWDRVGRWHWVQRRQTVAKVSTRKPGP